MRLGRVAHWEIGVVVQAVTLGFWLQRPTLGSAIAGAALGVAVVAAALRTRRLVPGLVGLVALAAGLTSLATSGRVRVVESAWPELRDGLLAEAQAELATELERTVDLARELAAAAVAIDGDDRERAFAQLERLVPATGPEHGVVLWRDGRRWIWAGRHRVEPASEAPAVSARITPFYVLLEARRQFSTREAVSQVLLAADRAIPDRARSLAAQFGRRVGVELQFVSPEEADVEGTMGFCAGGCAAGAADTMFRVRMVPPTQGDRKLAVLEAGSRWTTGLAIAALGLAFIAGGVAARWAGAAVLAGLFLLTPAGRRLGLGTLFDPATFFVNVFGPISASSGALLVSTAVILMGLLALSPDRAPRLRVWELLAAIVMVVLAPVVMVRLAAGITPPATTVTLGLWLSWELPLAAAGALLGLGAATLLTRNLPSRRVPGWVSLGAAGWSLALGVLGLLVWTPQDGWPAWYALLWLAPVALAVLPAPRPRLIATVAVVAGTAASVITWGAAVRGRLVLAERDTERLTGGDVVALSLLDRFGAQLSDGPVPRSAAALYARWTESHLSADDYPAALATWDADNRQVAALDLAELGIRPATLTRALDIARRIAEPYQTQLGLEPGLHYVVAVPFADGSVVTVAVAPRSRLIPPVPVARFLRGERGVDAPYDMFLGEMVPAPPSPGRVEWVRDGFRVRGTRVIDSGSGWRHLHVHVQLGQLPQLLVRGALVLFLDGLFIVLVWLGAEAFSGRVWMWTGIRTMTAVRSYRLRLTLALAGFFVIPTLGFALWSLSRIQAEAAGSRDLVIQQTLSDAAGTARQLAGRLGADLLWYEAGRLTVASPTVLHELGLLGQYLPPRVYRALVFEDDIDVTDDEQIGGHQTRVGYRSLGGPRGAAPVLAVPRLLDVAEIRREQEDLILGLLFATLVGLAGAAGLAAVAARSLARPVQSLRGAAMAVGQGMPLPPFDPDVPTEFVPVVEAFERMARDVEASQRALESARRRTATVLRNVATGVVALDRHMHVTIANPRAEELLAAVLNAGAPIRERTGAEWSEVWDWVLGFMGGSAEVDSQEFSVGVRRIRVQVAALHSDPSGCVVALDDMTEMARAVRVLAWGELARQIAHEIKNPLTPIRLGMQHLQRARRDGSADFDSTLERTARQILAEIERLDAIARAFARFGAPPAEAAPLKIEDVTLIARDAAELYQLSGGPDIRVDTDGRVEGLVRRDEVKEVLINLIENARDAGATEVVIGVRSGSERTATIVVQDDGRGITKEHLVRIFEPQFSTTTSGTGLGLAICKRLVESWGATIDVASAEGEGTTVTITMAVMS